MRNEDETDRIADAIEAPDVGDTEAAKKKAGEILTRARATVEEIAWAWVTLRDLDAGNGITSGEARYRKILFAQEEIEKLGLLKTNEAGFPVRKYNGVAVSGMNDGAIVRGLVSIPAVRDAFTASGVSWPGVAMASVLWQTVPMGNDTSAYRFAYLIKRAITNLQRSEISVDKNSIWDELVRLANDEAGVFLSAADNVIYYRSDDDGNKNKKYKREAFTKYWSRNKSKYGF